MTTLLSKTIFGKHLSERYLVSLSNFGKHLELKAGETLFREGERNRDFYVLMAGKMDLTVMVPGRGATRILTLGPGDLVAWSSIVGDKTMTCSATCVEPSKLIAVPAAEVEELAESDPKFGYEFMRMLASAIAQRLVATRLQLLDLFQAPKT